MYLDHRQNWLIYGHDLLIFLIFALFWIREMGQIWGFWQFSGERMGGGGDGLKFRTLFCPGHLQNWLDYGHALVIF